MHLLDLATGTADQLICALKSKKHIAKAVGIDLAKEMLTIGEKKLHKLNLSNKTELLEGSATNVPFKDHTFDCASISFGIRNIEPLNIGLQEMFRVLKPDGRALILEFSLPKNLLLKKGHLFYLRHILPKVGGLISRNAYAYSYLNQTIETFPYGKDFCLLLQETGFNHVRFQPLFGGIVTLYIADK